MRGTDVRYGPRRYSVLRHSGPTTAPDTWCYARRRYEAMCGTEIGYGARRSAECSTEMGYDARRSAVLRWGMVLGDLLDSSSAASGLSLPSSAPVLRYRMLLCCSTKMVYGPCSSVLTLCSIKYASSPIA
eukprot:819266-Rhodomonas_salina.2